MINKLFTTKNIVSLFVIKVGIVNMIYSQNIFAETARLQRVETYKASQKSHEMKEEKNVVELNRDFVEPQEKISNDGIVGSAADDPNKSQVGNTSSAQLKAKNAQDKFVDKWELNKMCLGKFCMDDPIAKHGGFKAFKLIKSEIKPKLIGCNKPSISLTFPKPSMGHTIIDVTPSHEYQKKGIDNYYRITSIYTYYPEISQENIKILTDKIVKRAESNYHNNEWVNPNSPGVKVHLYVASTFASLSLDEKLSEEEYNLLQKRIGCDNEAPDL